MYAEYMLRQSLLIYSLLKYDYYSISTTLDFYVFYVFILNSHNCRNQIMSTPLSGNIMQTLTTPNTQIDTYNKNNKKIHKEIHSF